MLPAAPRQSTDDANGILGTLAPGAPLTALGEQQPGDVARAVQSADGRWNIYEAVQGGGLADDTGLARALDGPDLGSFLGAI